MIYAYAAVALVIALLGGYAKIEHSGKIAAEAQVQALGSKIEEQNAAVQQTKADGDKRVAEAQKGVLAASKATLSARQEAARLRASAAQAVKPSACPAGDAVATIRAGLK